MINNGIVMRRSVPADYSPVTALLKAAGLPEDGARDCFENFVVADIDGAIVGAAGLELYGTQALLRSVVVDDVWRGNGIAARLVQDALALADGAGVEQVYLLTETAERYFPRHGFDFVDRSTITGPVLESVQFRSACPASLPVMVRVNG